MENFCMPRRNARPIAIEKLIFALAILGGGACGRSEAPPPPLGSQKTAASAGTTAAGATTAATTAPATAPDSFKVDFETSRGQFVVQIDRALAPQGADRFYQLVDAHFFDDGRFFRVVPGFVAQFGLPGDPKLNAAWDTKRLPDDSVKASNLRGTIVFATQGPRTRTHQLFINLVDNARLDPMGFAPIGRVVEGMAAVDSLYSGYGDKPDQMYIQTLGNDYLNRMFPKLDYIKSAKIVR
jgi:peptidyl-prolyl cis-trans isomerase A (cyclophilin A)